MKFNIQMTSYFSKGFTCKCFILIIQLVVFVIKADGIHVESPVNNRT